MAVRIPLVCTGSRQCCLNFFHPVSENFSIMVGIRMPQGIPQVSSGMFCVAWGHILGILIILRPGLSISTYTFHHRSFNRVSRSIVFFDQSMDRRSEQRKVVFAPLQLRRSFVRHQHFWRAGEIYMGPISFRYPGVSSLET